MKENLPPIEQPEKDLLDLVKFLKSQGYTDKESIEDALYAWPRNKKGELILLKGIREDD